MNTGCSQVPPRLKWVLAFLLSALLACIVVACLFQTGGCTRKNTRVTDFFSTNAPAAEMISAGNYLRELQMQNRLPGVSNRDHGQIRAEEITLTKSNVNEITYPIQRTFIVVKDGDRSHYHYRLVRSSKDVEWKLDRAWRTDSAGRVIEELPVE
jgi:hypothetical protein